jgi:hypothetical protein
MSNSNKEWWQTEEGRRANAEMEEAAERAGGYVAPPKHPIVIEYDYRAMSKYCCDKGIKPMELTEDELKMFLYDEPLVYA